MRTFEVGDTFVYTDKATSTKQFYTAEDISARMQELNEAEITGDARLVVEKSRRGDPDLHVPYKEYKVLSSEFYFEGTKSQNKKLVLEGTAEEFDPDYAHIVAIFYDKEGNVLSAVSRDFENYQSLFELMTKFLQPPDLLIYLRASVPTLIRHIAKRNREFEQSISISYLTNLNERYEKWISGYNEGKLLIIDTDNIELENPEDLSTVVDRIEASLNGLF